MILKMGLYFITGNEEIRVLVPSIDGFLSLDLPEIQSLNAREVIAHKLGEALRSHAYQHMISHAGDVREGTISMIACEDTSLEIDVLHGLPGPLIRWHLQALGVKGLYDLVLAKNEFDTERKICVSERWGATARTIVGLYDGSDYHYFEGEVRGKIVLPGGSMSFGWDPLFEVEWDGGRKRLSEMTLDEKNMVSSRGKAFGAFAQYLQTLR